MKLWTTSVWFRRKRRNRGLMGQKKKQKETEERFSDPREETEAGRRASNDAREEAEES
jgi:hypothetical protein